MNYKLCSVCSGKTGTTRDRCWQGTMTLIRSPLLLLSLLSRQVRSGLKFRLSVLFCFFQVQALKLMLIPSRETLAHLRKLKIRLLYRLTKMKRLQVDIKTLTHFTHYSWPVQTGRAPFSHLCTYGVPPLEVLCCVHVRVQELLLCYEVLYRNRTITHWN